MTRQQTLGNYTQRGHMSLISCLPSKEVCAAMAAVTGGALALWYRSKTNGTGPFLSPVSSLLGMQPKYTVDGKVEPGWEEVRRVFEANFVLGWERGAQLVVRHRGKVVVDLWGRNDASDVPAVRSPITGELYGPDTLQALFSSNKVTASLCLVMAVDRGWCDFGDTIVSLWPEFASDPASEKARLTVADLLRHETGLHAFDTPPTLAHLRDPALMSALIESSTPAWPTGEFIPATRRYYHAVTRGWIISSLLRKIDPQRRVCAEFLRDEVYSKLGVEAGFKLGVPTEEQGNLNLCHMEMPSKSYAFFTMLPFMLRMVTGTLPDALKEVLKASKDPQMKRKFANLGDDLVLEAGGGILDTVVDPRVLEAGIPSMGGVANARAMATIAACLANGGTIDGTCIVSDATLRRALLQPVVRHTGMVFVDTAFTQGGWCDLDHFIECNLKNKEVDVVQDGSSTYGWSGYGGSTLQFSTERQLGIAYAMTGMLTAPDDINENMMRLRKAIDTCAEAVGSKA